MMNRCRGRTTRERRRDVDTLHTAGQVFQSMEDGTEGDKKRSSYRKRKRLEWSPLSYTIRHPSYLNEHQFLLTDANKTSLSFHALTNPKCHF